MRVCAALACAALVGAALTACGGGRTGVDATPRPDGSAVLVTSGVRYAAAPQGWSDPTFDLYLPPDAGEPPVAVIVPDIGADAPDADYVALARDLAARGVIAAVVRWGVESTELDAVAGRPVEDVVAQTHQATAEVSCALGVVAARAGPGVGTPARPLVVVGHGAGANAAAMAVLVPGPVPAFGSCFEAGATPQPAAALLWDGDWLGFVAEDAFGADAASFLAAYSPWPSVDTVATSVFVEVGVNANRLVGQSVEIGPASSYLTTRDPGSALTDDLARARAFDDGVVDPVDVTRGFSVGLQDAGILSREREVHGEGDPDTLGPRVRALIVQGVVNLTQR